MRRLICGSTASIDSKASTSSPRRSTFCEQVLAQHGGNVALASRKANLLRAIGRTDEAVAVYLEIVDLFRKSDELDHATGIYQTVIGLQPEEMEHRRRQLDLFLQLGPEPVIVEKTLELAELCLERGEAPEASRLIERALEAAPESAELLERSGGLYEQCGRRGEAAERFLAAGQLCQRRGRLPMAQEAFERALRCVPEHLGRARGAGRRADAAGRSASVQRHLCRSGWVLSARARRRLGDSAVRTDPGGDRRPRADAGSAGRGAARRRRRGGPSGHPDPHRRPAPARAELGRVTELCEQILATHEDYLPAMERLLAVAEATRQDGDSNAQLRQLAQAHRRAGNQGEELAVLARLLEKDPLHAEAWQRQLELHALRSTPRAVAAAVGRVLRPVRAGRRGSPTRSKFSRGRPESSKIPSRRSLPGWRGCTRSPATRAARRRALRIQAELLGRLMRDSDALDVWEQLAHEEPDNHAILRMRIELMKRNDMTRGAGRGISPAGPGAGADRATTSRRRSRCWR